MSTCPGDSRNIYAVFLTWYENCSHWAFSECAAVTRTLLIPRTGFQFPGPCYLRKAKCLENNHQFVTPIANRISTVHFDNSQPVVTRSGHLATLSTKFTVLEKFHRLRWFPFVAFSSTIKKLHPPTNPFQGTARITDSPSKTLAKKRSTS